MRSSRSTWGLALAAFIVVGFVSWIALMPKASDATLAAAPLPSVTPTTPTIDEPSTTGDPSAEPSAEPSAPTPETSGAPAPSSTPEPTSTQEAAPVEVTVPDTWAEELSSRTGLPVASLRAWGDVARAQLDATPACPIDWAILAALADPGDTDPAALADVARAQAAAICVAGVDAADGPEGAAVAAGLSPERARLAAVLANGYRAREQG